MTGVPSGSQVTAAYLYWETLGNGQNGTFNGNNISGIRLGTVTSPCWLPPFIDVYRADVLSLLSPSGNASYPVAFPDSGNFSIAPSTEGAALVIVYTRADLPSKGIVIYDGAYTQTSGTPTFDLTIQGFTTAASISPQAKLTHIVGDGQPFSETLSFNGTTLGSPTNPFGGFQGPLWDDPTFDVSALVPGGASSVTTSVRWPFTPGNSNDCLTWGAVLFSTTTGQTSTATAHVEVLDPVPDLLSGPSVELPNIAANLNDLATKGTPRAGIATDGLAKLVLRFTAPAAAQVTFQLGDENGVAVAGGDDYGNLTDLYGLPLSNAVSIQTTSIGAGKYMAFALYRAPTHFVRNGYNDSSANQRAVTICVTTVRSSTCPSGATTRINIFRPPVVLVHGIWADPTSWDQFSLSSSTDCVDSGPFYACRADYGTQNAANGNQSSDKFNVSAPTVGSAIRQFIANFKRDKHAAAIHADVIAHSMGGDLVRVLPLCNTAVYQDCVFDYFLDSNFRAGDIGRVITIATPHFGSPLANAMWDNRTTSCTFGIWPFTKTATVTDLLAGVNLTIAGAVEDLRENVAPITTLTSHHPPFGIHFFVGTAATADETIVNAKLLQFVNDHCGSVFTGANIRSVFHNNDSDIIVSAPSQRGNLTSGATGTTDFDQHVIHTGKLNRDIHDPITLQIQLPSPPELTLKALGDAVIALLTGGIFIVP